MMEVNLSVQCTVDEEKELKHYLLTQNEFGYEFDVIDEDVHVSFFDAEAIMEEVRLRLDAKSWTHKLLEDYLAELLEYN